MCTREDPSKNKTGKNINTTTSSNIASIVRNGAMTENNFICMNIKRL